MTGPGKQTVSSEEVEALARRLDDLCPWSTVLNHSGWVDVVECIKAISEEAFQLLKKQVEEENAKL
jgi:hypothetical protein